MLHAEENKPEINERVRQIDDLIETYFRETGEIPDGWILERMANYLLIDILTATHKPQENMIVNASQLARRQQKYPTFSYEEWREDNNVPVF
jgi:hypothetical protein